MSEIRDQTPGGSPLGQSWHAEALCRVDRQPEELVEQIPELGDLINRIYTGIKRRRTNGQAILTVLRESSPFFPPSPEEVKEILAEADVAVSSVDLRAVHDSADRMLGQIRRKFCGECPVVDHCLEDGLNPHQLHVSSDPRENSESVPVGWWGNQDWSSRNKQQEEVNRG